jgi:hypothetical protein
MANGMPRGFREGHGGDIACSHRDCSCCPECAKRPEVVEVYGQHFWIASVAERIEMARMDGVKVNAMVTP